MLSSLNAIGFTAAVGLAASAAGLLGALTGLGGGVVIIPLLVIVFKVDIRYAIGASLVAVIAIIMPIIFVILAIKIRRISSADLPVAQTKKTNPNFSS